MKTQTVEGPASCHMERLAATVSAGVAEVMDTVALQRTPNTENLKQIFPEKELRGHSPNFHIRVSVTNLYIPTIDLPILLQDICGLIMGICTNRSQTHDCEKLGLRPRNSQKKDTSFSCNSQQETFVEEEVSWL
jgi:hypothetical protein